MNYLNTPTQGDVDDADAHIRKEDVVAKVLARRGDHAWLVHVISAMEACESYRPWRDKATGKAALKPDSG